MEMTAEVVQRLVLLCLGFLGKEKVMTLFSLKVCESVI